MKRCKLCGKDVTDYKIWAGWPYCNGCYSKMDEKMVKYGVSEEQVSEHAEGREDAEEK